MFRVCLGYVSFRHLAHLVCQFFGIFLSGLAGRQNCISNNGIVLKTFEMEKKLVYIPVLGVFYKPSKERGTPMKRAER